MEKVKKFLMDILKSKKFLFIALPIFVGVLILDLVTKACWDYKVIEVINGVVRIEWAHNDGAAWSFLSGKLWLLVTLTIVFLILFAVGNYFFKNKNALYYVAAGLIYGGAIGNMIDRLHFRYVRDFIKLEFWETFPTFNFADSALCIGVVLLCVFLVFIEPRQKTEVIDASKNATEKSNKQEKASDAEVKIAKKEDAKEQKATKEQKAVKEQKPASKDITKKTSKIGKDEK